MFIFIRRKFNVVNFIRIQTKSKLTYFNTENENDRRFVLTSHLGFVSLRFRDKYLRNIILNFSRVTFRLGTISFTPTLNNFSMLLSYKLMIKTVHGQWSIGMRTRIRRAEKPLKIHEKPKFGSKHFCFVFFFENYS